jgi:hypothetical protein
VTAAGCTSSNMVHQGLPCFSLKMLHPVQMSSATLPQSLTQTLRISDDCPSTKQNNNLSKYSLSVIGVLKNNLAIKAKLKLFLLTMKMYRVVEVWLHEFLTSTLMEMRCQLTIQLLYPCANSS